MPHFFHMIGRAVETGAHAVAAGAQLGLNKDANRNMHRAADKCGEHATKVGLDVGGFATNTVGPALQTAGHAIASGACAAADAATFGQVDDLRHARDDQARRANHAAKNFEAGWARLTNQKEPWFRKGPADVGPWMARVPNDRLISEMFLPGTHDSGSMHGGDIAECQSWSIEKQLKAGIRCFDIRLRQTGDALAVHHGVVFQHAFWPSVAKDFEDFLWRNPSEVILARISGSGCSHDSRWRFNQHVLSQIPQSACWAKLGADLGSTPLRNLRGCVVAIQCPFNDTYVELQDEWSIGNAEQKWGKVWEHACMKRERGAVYMNYLSATGSDGMGYITPAGLAYQVNRMAYDHMRSFRHSIVMMDYPGMGLIERIIERNF